VTFFGQLVGKSLEAQLLIALWNTFLTTGGLWLLGVSVGLFLGLGRSLFRLLGVSVRLCGASRADASREGRAVPVPLELLGPFDAMRGSARNIREGAHGEVDLHPEKKQSDVRLECAHLSSLLRVLSPI